ncbi:hypothetical protein [uncultured Microbacterium sp.]|uniref:hypothetical protein n=1 Tax=uncultured Microbacterium sp. TaxID=191216 RepID=UPI002619627D|nr:hypothetical protein [uncultured Microbacterium sp.]
MTESDKPTGVSRRTVTTAMAWAVPAVALAAPVAAFATSGPKPGLSLGAACKAPGGSLKCQGVDFKFGYGVPVTVTNSGPLDIWIYSLAITSQIPADPALTPTAAVPLPVKVPANGGSVTFLMGGTSTNSSNWSGSLTLELAWGHTQTHAGDTDHDSNPIVATVSWAETPPGCVCP